jgi:hypothetical protein
MVQRQVAFESTKKQQEALTLSKISPKWARRRGERQELPVPMSISWLRRYFELKRASRCVVEKYIDIQHLTCMTAENVTRWAGDLCFILPCIHFLN